MLSFFIYGEKGTPCALADEKGHRLLLLDVPNDSVKKIEDILRNTSIQFGLFVGIAFHPFNKKMIKEKCVEYSISRCWRLGRAILQARKNMTDLMKVMEEVENAQLVFKGKITDLERKTERGFNFGKIKI